MNQTTAITRNFSTLFGAGALLATTAVFSQPAEAFLITNTSASWDNVTLVDGNIVGSLGAAASDANLVKFLEVDGQSQVRWGSAATGGHYEMQSKTVTEEIKVPKTREVQVPVYNKKGEIKKYKTVTETYYETQTVTKVIQEKVWVPPTYKNQSGLGYKGVSNLDIKAGDIFNIGTLSHFNQTIWSNNLIGQSADIALNLNFSDPSIGSRKFNFTMLIDETPNKQAVCPYKTDAGKGCSDKITWNFAIDEKNTFKYNDEEYSLELVGFANELASRPLVTDFISQEGGDNSASLFARLVKVDRTRDIPEPASLLGLAGLGLYFARSRRQQSEAEIA